MHYNYFRKDHLGSNREIWNGIRKNYSGTVKEQAATRQRTQYYPSGLPWASNTVDYPSIQSHKYNGKEFVEMHGLDTYDYGARGYYPAMGRFMTVDPLAEKYYSISPYAYCAGNPVNRIDPDGMDWYTSIDGKTTYWQAGNKKVDGYTNSETNTQQIDDNTTITYTQDKATSTTTNTMTPDEWVSQYSKPMWGNTPADKACNKACDAMLANEGVKSSGMVVIVNNAGNGRAGTANNNASDAIDNMSTALDLGKPTKVNVDYKNGGKNSADGMGDHFVVVPGKTETLNNGQVMSTSFHYFNPGAHDVNAGTSPNNTINIMNRTLVGPKANNGVNIVVTSIRPSR